MKKQILFISSLFTIIVGETFSQTILNETFEAGLPGTWLQTTLASDGGWNNGTAADLSSSSYPFSATNTTKFMGTNDDKCGQNCNKSADRLISPSMDLTSTANYRLSVDIHFQKGTYQGKTETGTIEISIDGGLSWTLLRNLTGVADWRRESIDLSSYSGNNDVKISFLYNDDGGWLFGFGMDNFNVYIPQQNDAILVSTTLNRYSLANANNTLALNVANNGSNPITSLTVSWNDGTVHSETVNVNIPVGGSATVNHPVAVNYSAAITHEIDVEITQVNGTNDPAPEDNSANTLITILSQSPTKRVVIEEGTGTWCQWCPRGAVAMEYMYNTYPDRFIGIAVHNGDPMAVTEYDNGANFSGYPSANIDRAILDGDVSQSAFQTYYNQRKDLLTPASVSVSGVRSGSDLQVEVNATFFSQFPAANYRLGVIIIEDGVTGTGTGYNQANAYAGGGYGPMGGYENLPATIPASQMVYDHVGRALLGGYNGQAGSVPSSISDGMPVSYTFNYTVPAAYNIDNMYAVGVVIDNTTGEIINANKSPLANLSVGNIETIEMDVFPNPATDKITISFEAQGGDYLVEITDLQGRTVVSEKHTNLSGSQSVDLNTSNLKTGNYLVSVAKDGSSFTKMISIK